MRLKKTSDLYTLVKTKYHMLDDEVNSVRKPAYLKDFHNVAQNNV